MPISFPFPVRVSVGLVVAGVEQLRKLPGDLPTLGVTAAGQAMRLSMRVQQEFADLAIRGDEVLALIGGQPAEHPSWATFDEEDAEAADHLTTVVTVVPDTADAAIASADQEEDGYSGDATQELAEVIALDLVAMAQSAGRAEEPAAGSLIDAGTAGTPGTADTDNVATDRTEDTGGDESGGADEGRDAERSTDLEDDGDVASPTQPGSNGNGAGDGPDDYESLTLAELRGRLRRLSAAQVSDLLGRERVGADRPAFVTLLSNRLTSMEQGHP